MGKRILFLLLLASSAHAVNLPSMCGDLTNPTGCTMMPWSAIDFSLPDAPTPCNYAGGYFVAGISSVGAFDCQLVSGGGGSADCAGAPTLACLAGRTSTTNDPTISSDDNGTITGSATTGKSLILKANAVGVSDSVRVEENGLGQSRVVVGPGVDPVGALTYLVTGENNGNGALFGAYYAGDDGGAPTFFFFRSRNTSTSPTHTDADDVIANMAAAGFDSTNTLITGPPGFFLTVKQAGATAVGYVAMSAGIYTVDTTGTFFPRILINDDGSVTFPPNVIAGANLDVTGVTHLADAVFLGGAIPTCGTGCASLSTTSNDRIMDVTVSAGVVTSVTVNFSATLSSIPICTATSNSLTALPAITAVSTSAITIQTTATIGSGHLYAHCLEAS